MSCGRRGLPRQPRPRSNRPARRSLLEFCQGELPWSDIAPPDLDPDPRALALYSVPGAGAGPPTDQLRSGVDRVFKILKDPELEGEKKISQRVLEHYNSFFKLGLSETHKLELVEYLKSL